MTSSDFARAVAFRRENALRRADRAMRTDHGMALFTDDLPRVWFLNQLLVDLGASTTADKLVAEADDTLGAAGLAHRWISVHDDLGAAVADDLRQLHWTVEQDVVMAHRGSQVDVDTRAVEEVTADDLAPVWASSWRDHPDAIGECAVKQLVESRYPRRSGYDVRYFAVRDEGTIAGHCELFSDGRTGQIENVLVMDEYRGRGLGKAMTAGALAASRERHDLTFLVADAEDWPKALYRSLGFQAVGTTWTFTRRPASD